MSAFMFGATPTQRLQWRQSGSPDHRQSQMSGGPSQPDDDLGWGFSPWRLLSFAGVRAVSPAALALPCFCRNGWPAQRWWVIFTSALAKDPVFRPQEGSPHKNGTISKSRSLARPISAL